MRIQKRRRREAKTDYSKRIKLLKSERPRVIFRKTNKYILSQYIKSKAAQDSIIFEVTSKELLRTGWPKEMSGSLKSLPASYLTGFLVSKKIIKEKMEEPIVDWGMLRTINKTRAYAFLKGLIDGGLKISCKEEAFPEEDRIKGKFLKEDFSKKFEEIKLKIK